MRSDSQVTASAAKRSFLSTDWRSLLWESPSRLSIAARWWIVSSARRLRRKAAPCPRPLTTKRQLPLFPPERPCRAMKFASWMIVATKFRTAPKDFCGFVALRQPLATTAIPKRPKRCCRLARRPARENTPGWTRATALTAPMVKSMSRDA